MAGSEERVVWSQQLEVLSVRDLDEHCSYPVHGLLQPASVLRFRRSARWSPGPPRVVAAAMLGLLDEVLTVGHRPDIDVFVGDGHYACELMVAGPEPGPSSRQQAALRRRPVGALDRAARASTRGASTAPASRQLY